MLPSIYLHDAPNVTQAYLEASFEAYFPSQSTGYVRKLDERDCSHEFFKDGWFGFFGSDGNLIGTSDIMSAVFAKAKQEKFKPYYVN